MVLRLENSEPIRFTQEAPAAATSAALDGRYFSPELARTYAIERRGQSYTLSLIDPEADELVSFRLERLNGDAYLAHAETASGSLHDFIVTFHHSAGGGRTVAKLSSVAGLSGITNLTLVKCAAHSGKSRRNSKRDLPVGNFQRCE